MAVEWSTDADGRFSARYALPFGVTATFDLSQPTISHHLKILREAGLVEARRRGTWSYYRLVPEAIDALRGALGA